MCFGSLVIILVHFGRIDVADSDQTALARLLRSIGRQHPDMVTWWENAINELHENGMGYNTVNETKRAFDEIKGGPMDAPKKSFLALAEAFTILAKYNDEPYRLSGEHEIVYVLIDPNELTDGDKHRLDELGLFVDEDCECMAMFT